MSPVLITDAEQRSSLAAVRSLGRAGFDVVACSAHPAPLAGASRYCGSTVHVADPGADPEGFQRDVLAAARDSGATVLLPMTDVSAPLLLDLAARHDDLVVPYPAVEDYRAISDKAHLTAVATELDVPVPGQRVLDTPDELRDDDDFADIGFPCYLKPSRSAVDTPNGVVRLAVEMCATREGLSRAAEAYPRESYPLLVQKRVVGPGLGVFVLSWDGETVASFAHHRLREKPPTGGVSTYREGVEVRPDLLEYSERLLRHFRWRGVAMVEFKEDASTGTPYLMEVNGRFWGSLQLGIDSGIDFPALLVRLARGDQVPPVAPHRPGIRSRWFWGDVDHLLWVLRASRAARREARGLPGRVSAVLRFLLPWKPGDRFEVFRFSDPAPFFRETLDWFRALGGRA